MCECDFEYPFRWPQFYEDLLSGNGVALHRAVAILEERDRALMDHLANRCCNGAIECLFTYPSIWSEFVEPLLSQDSTQVGRAVGAIEDNDRALEDHLGARPCFGSNPAVGITCNFDYPSRWRDVYKPLLSGEDRYVQSAVAILEERDRALELHLKLRVCQPSS